MADAKKPARAGDSGEACYYATTDSSRENSGIAANSQARLDAGAVRTAARGRWPDILARCGIDARALRNRHGPCPGCGGTDRFRFDDRERRGTYYCSGAGDATSGDGFALLRHVHGCDFPRALRMVADALGMAGGEPAPTRPAPPPAPARREKRTTLASDAAARWHRARPITEGTVAARYLAARECALPHPDGDLRWHPRVEHWRAGHIGPALVALITDARTAAPVSMHMTWLTPDGSGKADLDAPRLTLPGQTNRGVIRLWPDHEVETGLAAGEGVETALSFARVFAPVWATVVGNNLASLPALPGIECLTILVDDDPAGRKAAHECAARWDEAGAEVRLIEV